MKLSCCEIVQRSVYTLQMMLRHWVCVRSVYHISPATHRITELDPLSLVDQGVQVLALDFDGVLASDGTPFPSPKVQQWLDHCVRQLGTERVFILSNKPRPERISWFKEQYPGLRFISGVRKKPYPDGLQAIQQCTQVPFQAILLVDDRLLTGVLAACIAQTQALHIRTPYVELSKHPVKESFFMLLRGIEKVLFFF